MDQRDFGDSCCQSDHGCYSTVGLPGFGGIGFACHKRGRLVGVDNQIWPALVIISDVGLPDAPLHIVYRRDPFSVLYDEWADEAFLDVDAVMLAHQRGSGRDIASDTTDASGLATFEVKPGTYWVHARYEEPYSELYWSVPVTVARGEPFLFTINRGNAIQRPKL